MPYVKFLNWNCRSKYWNYAWPLPLGEKPGAWTDKLAGIALCKWGYHFTDTDHLWTWLGARAFEVSVGAKILGEPGDDKYVAEQARLLRELPINTPEVVGNTIGNIIEYLRAALVLGDSLASTSGSLWESNILDFLQLAAGIFQRRVFTLAERQEMAKLLSGDIAEIMQQHEGYLINASYTAVTNKAMWYSLNTHMGFVVMAICRMLHVGFGATKSDFSGFSVSSLAHTFGEAPLVDWVASLLADVLVVNETPYPYDTLPQYDNKVIDTKVVMRRLFTIETSRILARQLLPDVNIPNLVGYVQLNKELGSRL